MRVVIDRFEGGYAVCEDEYRNMLNIEKIKLPREAKEGDILVIVGESIYIDTADTGRRKYEMDKQMNELFE